MVESCNIHILLIVMQGIIHNKKNNKIKILNQNYKELSLQCIQAAILLIDLLKAGKENKSMQSTNKKSELLWIIYYKLMTIISLKELEFVAKKLDQKIKSLRLISQKHHLHIDSTIPLNKLNISFKLSLKIKKLLFHLGLERSVEIQLIMKYIMVHKDLEQI